MVCVSVYSTLLTLNVRAFTLINLNFSIYFSIKSYFFYILQDHFTKHPHILPFILFKYTHIYSFFKIFYLKSLSHIFLCLRSSISSHSSYSFAFSSQIYSLSHSPFNHYVSLLYPVNLQLSLSS